MVSQKGHYKNLNQELIDGCKAGDQKAQFRLYKQYYQSMYNVSLRIINDPVESEDVMQESFLSAFEKINSYEGNVSFGAWLRKIVVNRSLDALRKRKPDWYDLQNDSGELPETELVEYDNEEVILKVEKIKKALSRLPDGYRIILSLYLFEGYDHEEIGKIMNINNSTSRSQYARARKKLVELINTMD